MTSRSTPDCRELSKIDLQIKNSPGGGSAKFGVYPKKSDNHNNCNNMVQYLDSSQSLHDDSFFSSTSLNNNNNNNNNINNINNRCSSNNNRNSSINNIDTSIHSPLGGDSSSSDPVVRCACPVMASSSNDPNQATPLLVGVKLINEWPNRNGNIGNNNRNNTSIPNPLTARGGDQQVAIMVDDDKPDAYNVNGSVSQIMTDTDFPQEKFKTFVALMILTLSFFFTTISLAIVHDRVPNRSIYKPLPDTFLDLVAAREWALSVSEIFIMINTNITLLIVVFHKHRYIVFRRMFLMLSLLYFMRSVTMFVTVLPVSSESYECSEQVKNPSVGLILLRAIQLCSGLGLTINGKHTYCGDYIYSGHTTILVTGYLMICEYSPRRYYLLHWSAWIMAFVGVIMVLVSHGHYTLDVIIAYYITTRLFWLYHTLASNQHLKERHPNNYLAREWWFRFFQYFEGNVKGPVPLEYNFPISWPPFKSRRYRCND